MSLAVVERRAFSAAGNRDSAAQWRARRVAKSKVPYLAVAKVFSISEKQNASTTTHLQN